MKFCCGRFVQCVQSSALCAFLVAALIIGFLVVFGVVLGKITYQEQHPIEILDRLNQDIETAG